MLYNNIIASQSGFYPAFNKPLTSGVSDAGTFTSASAQYVYDHENVLRKVESGSIAIPGSRIVTNLLTYSEDLSNATWVKGGTCTVTGTQVVNLPSVNDSVSQVKPINPANQTFVASFNLSGIGTVTLQLSNNVDQTAGSKTITLSATPQKYSVAGVFNSTSGSARVVIKRSSGNTATSVTVHAAQLQNVTGQSNQNPGEYVKTTSAAVTKCFSTTNGNTVNGTTGVVTEGTGVALTTIKGPLLEVASTNKVTAYGIIPADTLGSELVTNGGFDSDTAWGKGTNASISGGVLSYAGGSGNTVSYQNNTLAQGKYYQATFTITAITKGSVKVRCGTSSVGTFRTAIGTYTEQWQVPTGPTSTVVVEPSADFVGSVDSISIKEVTWAVGTKSYWTGSEFQQNITGLTLSGDTAAVLSIVTDQTEITNAGLAGINPTWKVYKLDNSAGSTWANVIITGTVGNTNTQTASVFSRATAQYSQLMSTEGSSPGTNQNSFTYYVRQNLTFVPLSSVNQTQISTTATGVVYFLLPQLEEQAAATSYIPTAGATATRAATSLSYPTSGIFSLPLSGTFYWTPSGIKGSTEYLWGSYLDSNNSIGVFYDGTNVTFRKRVGGSNFDATKALTAVAGTTYRIGWRINANYSTDLAVDGTLGTGSADTTAPAATTTFKLGDDGNGANGLLSSQERDFKIYRKALPDTRL